MINEERAKVLLEYMDPDGEFSKQQLIYALEDGEYLDTCRMTQDDVEFLYHYLQEV